VVNRRPKPPESLGPAGGMFWKGVLADYDLSVAELAILGRACRTLDVLTQIDTAIADDGVTVEGSVGQVRAHPLLRSLVDLETVLDAQLRTMALPLTGEDEGQVRSRAAVVAAQARWRERDRHSG
jgi:hypothetical protein